MGRSFRKTTWSLNRHELMSDKHVLNVIKKANSKLSTLSRLTKFMILWRKGPLYKAFVEPQFKYCPLTWILHSLKTNYKINRLQDRPLRLIYNDHISSFEELLSKDGTFTIHEQNIQNLAIEMFKALNDLSTPDFWELFQLNESLHGLRSNDFKNFVFPISTLLDLVKVLFDTLVQWSGILYQQKLGMLILSHLLGKWKPSNCQCRLYCVGILGEIGFTNIRE